jgi:hypothetical protein
MRQLETTTVQSGVRTTLSPAKSEYVRDVEQVIGWDLGQDATVSFVECSGGVRSGRAYHGRPMVRSNPKLKGQP